MARRGSAGEVCALLGLGALGLVAKGCIAMDSPLIQESALGCAELASGDSAAGAAVDPDVRDVMLATVSVRAAVAELRASTFTACAGIAVAAGAEDTWSTLPTLDEAVSNVYGTGACDRAAQALARFLLDPGRGITVAVSRGQCRLDFNEQKACDATCADAGSCDSGSIERRCEQGGLSVVCGGNCAPGAECLGTPASRAPCDGACEGVCIGACDGECVGAEGRSMPAGPACRGKCRARCTGTCTGACRIESAAGSSCGPSARCTGGCSDAAREPVCVRAFVPPSCAERQVCLEACSAALKTRPTCTPTSASVFSDTRAHPELAAVGAALARELPVLIEGRTRRELLRRAIEQLGAAGGKLAELRTEDLDGRSLACAGESGTAIVRDLLSVELCASGGERVLLASGVEALP